MVIGKATGAAVAASGLLIAVAACGSSSPPYQAAVSGTEHFTATTAKMAVIESKNATVPVKATGAFTDSGTIDLDGSGSTSVLKFPNGTITVSDQRGDTRSALDKSDCHAMVTNSGIQYKITGGTGRFKGITGSGTADIAIDASLPRTSAGGCDASSHAVPTAAREAFAANGPVSFG